MCALPGSNTVRPSVRVVSDATGRLVLEITLSGKVFKRPIETRECGAGCLWRRHRTVVTDLRSGQNVVLTTVSESAARTPAERRVDAARKLAETLVAHGLVG